MRPGSWLASTASIQAGSVVPRWRLPVDVFELEAAPRTARILLLSACDGQQAAIERGDEPGRALLRLQLPTRPDPQSHRDWTWVACPVPLPPTVPANAVLHLPALRIHQSKVRADLAYTHAVPKAQRTGHTVALGVDWGLNTLLSAGAARLHDDGRITAPGSGGMFRAAGVLAKQHRLRRLSEHLHAKADHYQRLTGGHAEHPLSSRHQVLTAEIRHVCDRRSNLNDALAWSAARWTVDQAIAASATVIHVEDLRSMEAKGMGRSINTRMSQQVRGQIVDRMRHLAAEAGIAVVRVPARNTSKHCPPCLVPLRHRKAPDRPGLEVGCLQFLRLSGRPRRGCMEAHRRTRPHPPGEDRDRTRRRCHGHPLGGRQTRSQSHGHPDHREDQPGPVQDRTHPATDSTPRAQATQGPPPALRVRRASVRGDTLTRTGPGCPAQPTGTRA
ncbi:hypothetical protein [Streptomyces sp. 2A115]|uniref:hypothetical protein n=1 Tax=Streptomyces sp. 2A115 TaxID=3457439 RepID=UPI003FCF8CAF